MDAAIGLADVEANRPMTSATRMLAASVGKTIVGALVLSLESTGVLDREDLISEYLGDAEWFEDLPNAETIRVKHLLNHSSGLPDHVYMDDVAAHLIEAGALGDIRPELAIAFTLNTQALFTGEAMDVPYLARLLEGMPVHPDAPGIFYGSGVAIYADTPFGPVYGHGGWLPGYVTSLRHYGDHGISIAFQINTDIGIADDSSDLVPALEAALAELIIDAMHAE